jgi:hypothetical protein
MLLLFRKRKNTIFKLKMFKDIDITEIEKKKKDQEA